MPPLLDDVLLTALGGDDRSSDAVSGRGER
jgi:hypothetical protein